MLNVESRHCRYPRCWIQLTCVICICITESRVDASRGISYWWVHCMLHLTCSYETMGYDGLINTWFEGKYKKSFFPPTFKNTRYESSGIANKNIYIVVHVNSFSLSFVKYGPLSFCEVNKINWTYSAQFIYFLSHKEWYVDVVSFISAVRVIIKYTLTIDLI